MTIWEYSPSPVVRVYIGTRGHLPLRGNIAERDKRPSPLPSCTAKCLSQSPLKKTLFSAQSVTCTASPG